MTPKACRMTSWDGPIPEAGEFLRTDAGSTYLILTRRDNTRPDPKSICAMQLGKLDPDEIAAMPVDAVVHGFQWNARG
jgi:hypothetical protein